MASAGAQTRAGGEFQVNTYSTGFQWYPAVALSPSGGFFVVWEDTAGLDGDGVAVMGRRYDPAGAPLGSPFVVNTTTASAEWMPSVYSDPRGGFIAAWSRTTSAGAVIDAQRFDPAGRRQGGEFQISTYAPDILTAPVVAFDGAGNFVAVWVAQLQDSLSTGIYSQRFDASGARLGTEFRVNSYTSSNQQTPSVIRDPAGGFVIAWQSTGQDGFAVLALAQRFDAAGGRVGAEFRLGEGTIQSRPTLARRADGGFVATWMGADGSGDGVFARRFDAAGTPQGPEFLVNQETLNQQFWPGLSADATGNFTVAWTSYTQGAAGFDIKAARCRAGGQRRGSDFLVNTYTQGDQYVNVNAPTLASDPSGNFVVVWTSLGQDGSGYGVFAQRHGGLVPVGANVETGAGLNGVLEPGETVDVRPSWRNVNGVAQTFTGTLAELTGPAGAVYTINDASAAYGTVANGASAPCSDCYVVSVSAPAVRPAAHWDAVGVEVLAPDTQGQVKRWPLHIGSSFADVPASSPFYRFVETLLHRGVTAGCTATTYCPASATTREQM
ncbi:MAG TPA: S-layer homology domain-containing protein, partial [Myxococcales bacterium]|nr:S-layer homology domain-containing protein [Myxococcales bacterium]